jgi:ubiquinone/menaquinone biosynthesis C-methylase UbiE
MKKPFSTKKIGANKLLADYVEEQLSKYKDLKKSTLLEIGCGNGRFGHLIGDKLKTYRGIDPDKEYLELAKKEIPYPNIKYRKGFAEKVPYKKKFDIIFYSFSWHYIKDFDKAIKEASRVIKNNGIILIIDPMVGSKNFCCNKLNRGSKEFDEKAYKIKMRKLKEGLKELKKQKTFKILENQTGNINLFILNKIIKTP